MNWADLFERAEPYETDVETIREALAARREEKLQGDEVEEEDDA
jgi:hypothetical protein